MNDDRHQKRPARCFASRLLPRFIFLLIALPLVAGVASQLWGQEVSARFPDPAQVTADYPDEAQRYAAFETLDMVLSADTPKPVSKTAYNKLFAYEASYNNIESMHLQQRMQSQAYKDWVVQRDQMINDMAFAKSVLAKYQLTVLKAAPRPALTPQPLPVATPIATPQPLPVATPVATPVANVSTPSYQFLTPAPDEHHGFLRLMPLAIVSWVLMYVVARLLIARSGVKSLLARPPQLETGGDWPPLPEDLRVIHLPGVRYFTKTYSGLVLDKSTSVTTSTFTSTTPSQVNVIGNVVQVTPGQTVTHQTRRQADSLRVRTPDLKEATWTLTGLSGNSVFRGQMVTALARPVKNDFFEFILAYNHATGELIRVEEGLEAAHSTSGIIAWFAQPLATLVGTIGFSIVIGYLLTSPPPIIVFDLGMGGLILLLVGGFCSLTVAFFMCTWIRRSISDSRSKKLLSKYGPAFRKYCEQITPAMQRRLMR